MNKGMNIFSLLAALLLISSMASAQIYKVVDEDGNITFTDQAPADGSKPMELPELSVIETDVQPETAPEATDTETAAVAEELKEPTPRELRRMYRDFRITRPTHEENFWGTANTVVVSWAASEPLLPNLNVRVFVDGTPREDTEGGMIALVLDRGEHQVYAEMRDARGRRIVVTDTVTFFVMQQSVGSNRPVVRPNRGP